MRYESYLLTKEWQAKRLEKAIEQNYTCEICGKVVPKGFNIHHKTYKRLGCELMTDLMFLCEDCHMLVHEKIKKRKESDKKSRKTKANKKIIENKIVKNKFICPKCGCDKAQIKMFKVNIGAYCVECGTYIKFLNKEELGKIGISRKVK